jgi:hypothetical protein
MYALVMLDPYVREGMGFTVLSWMSVSKSVAVCHRYLLAVTFGNGTLVREPVDGLGISDAKRARDVALMTAVASVRLRGRHTNRRLREGPCYCVGLGLCGRLHGFQVVRVGFY